MRPDIEPVGDIIPTAPAPWSEFVRTRRGVIHWARPLSHNHSGRHHCASYADGVPVLRPLNGSAIEPTCRTCRRAWERARLAQDAREIVRAFSDDYVHVGEFGPYSKALARAVARRILEVTK